MTEQNGNESQYSVAVVVPAYNNAGFVGRAIDSILAQTLPADEIIVVDDGSTDNTADIVRSYGQQVRYIYQESAGASVARNTGIEAAKSDWIAFLDADDEWLPEKLKLQTEHLERNPDIVWTTANFLRCMCWQDRRSAHMPPELSRQLLGEREYFDDYFDAFLKRSDGWTGAMVIRRNVLIEAGLFRPGQLISNDFDMWWRIAYRYPKIGFIAEPLAIYHLDVEGSTIRRHKDSGLFCELIDRHLKLSAEHGRYDEFSPCAAFLLRRWMRSMLFEGQGAEIRDMISQFERLFGAGYKAGMRALTIFPRLTAAGCRGISQIVRLLGLPRQLARSRK